MPGPLSGVRVIDLTQVIQGPWATQIMGDMGAEVIKLEPPKGDITRAIGPSRHPGMASMFLCCNRNKRSVALDLKAPEARALALELVRTADVFIHSMRPEAIERLGLGYGAVAEANPRIVYAACHGFGTDAPYADRPAYDDIIQGLTGLAYLQGRTSGRAGYVPSIICDKTMALAVVANVSMALFHRERSGRGQRVESAMFETMTAFNMVEHLYGRTFEPPVGDTGYKRLLSPQRRPYPTRDGHIGILPYNDRQWVELFQLTGRADLAADRRFTTVVERNRHIDLVYAELEAIIAERSTGEWLELLAGSNIPHCQINTLDDLLHDPHLEAVGFWHLAEHPSEGTIRMAGVPSRFSDSPGGIRSLPARLGEHTREVLAEAGLSAAAIDDLLGRGVAVQAELEPATADPVA